jgi:DNA invertase Pin-like site-specific DNA recombinase
MIYSHARISTAGQCVGMQATALTAARAEKLFRKVASGPHTDRAQLRRSIDALGPGDELRVTRLDRLARSTRDLPNTLAAITGKQAARAKARRRNACRDRA